MRKSNNGNGSTPLIRKPRASSHTDSMQFESEYATLDARKKMERDYHHYTHRKFLFIVACVVGMLIVMAVAVMFGSSGISVIDVYKDIWYHFFNTDKLNAITDWVVFTMRLPRVLTGLVVGASLGVCGACMQGMLRNPLADPYTTGISSGASFGATLSIAFGITVGSIGGIFGTVMMAFVCALIPAGVIIIVSSLKKTSASMMILSGIGVMYLFDACTTIIKLGVNDTTLTALYRWSLGDLSDATWLNLGIVTLFTVVGTVVIMFFSKKLNIMITGDKNSTALGVNAHKIRIILLLVVSLMAASVVSFFGIIGFVGIVSPHIVRIFLGADNRYLIPASAAFGGLFLMCADLVSRVIAAPDFIPVGVICAFVGAPLFIYLLVRQRRSSW